MMKSFLIALCVPLILATPLRAETPNKVFKGSYSPYFGADYQPRQAKSLDEVPVPIRATLEKHLRKRLGEAFYRTLEFSGGEIVDIEELHRVYPRSKDYQWEVFAYHLKFLVKQPNREIEYHAGIKLRKNGTVLEDIDLPAVAMFPDRAAIIPLHAALETAAKAGIDITDSEAEMKYLEKEGVVAFLIRQYIGKTGSVHHIRCVRVNAHNGKLIDVSMLTADG